MSERRRGLGRGLGALIPTAIPTASAQAHQALADAFFPPGSARGSVDTSVDTSVQDAEDGARGGPQAGRPGTAGDAAPSALWHEPGRAGTYQTELLPVPGAHFADVPVDDVIPNPRQPRQVFDEEALDELVQSVREIGVLQPVVVRPVTDPAAPDGSGGHAGPGDRGAPERYELVMGERRWRAAQLAGLATVPAIVRETSDDDLLRDALLENLHRTQLNPLEEAAAYQQLLDDFGCTHEHLAQRIKRSRPQISNTIRLLRLPPSVQRRVAAGVLSAGHARALLGLADGAAMERLAQRIVAEGLSVRATEEAVALGGDDGTAGARAPRARTRRGGAALDDLAARLSDRFETRVSVAMGQRRGRLTVEFATVEDLNRILGALAPEDPGVPDAGVPAL